ncbi:COX15/CtaA family protein [Paenibacillus sp. P26]|nr:COX15/CtaA family protein [Paenibacillus sp. P26]
MKIAVWVSLVYTYVVVYLGAFVRHTESLGGCIGWPLCNGEVIPDLHGATAIVFTHRVAAAGLGIFLLLMFISIRSQAGTQSSVYHAPSGL